MASDSFRAKQLADLNDVLAANEQASCMDGTSCSLFIGTTLGRIVSIKFGKNGEVELGPSCQLQTKSVITQLLVASALDIIIVISVSTVFYIDMVSLKVQSASTSSNIVCMAANVNPVTEDPFALQLALGTAGRLVVVCERSGATLAVRYRVPTEQCVEALAYSRECVCYATRDKYFVHHLARNLTHSLFPYERASTRPLIVNVDTEEFLVNGMQGLAVYATSAGVSSRPPLLWGTDAVVSAVYHSPYVLVLSSSSLAVFRCDKAMEVQRTPIDCGSLLANIDGRIFFCAKKFVNLFEEISCFDRAEALFAENHVEEALKLAEGEILNRSYDEAEILKLKKLKEKAAVKFFCDGEFEKCQELAISSEMDPRELISFYCMSAGFPCTFASSYEQPHTLDTSTSEYVDFLGSYLNRIRKEHWAAAYRKEVHTVLIMLFSMKNVLPESSDLPGFGSSLIDCQGWLRERSRFAFLAQLAFRFDSFAEAVEASKEAFLAGQMDRQLAVLALNHLSQISEVSEKLSLRLLEFLLKFDSKLVLMTLKNCITVLSPFSLVTLLEPYRNELICYLEEAFQLQVPELHTHLALLYIDEINRAVTTEEDECERDAESYRKSLRRLFFGSQMFDEKKVLSEMRGLPHFEVECLLLRARKGENVEMILEKLLKKYNDFGAADLLCCFLDSSERKLCQTLLKYYTSTNKFQPEFDERIVNLLHEMNASANAAEVIREIPDEWPLSKLKMFAARAISATEFHEHCDRLKLSALTKAVQELSLEAKSASGRAVWVDELAKCAVCGELLGNDDVVLFPNSSSLVHRICSSVTHS